MASPAVDGHVYRVRINYLLHGQECFNVLHFKAHGTPDLVTDLLEACLECFTENLLPILSNDLTITKVDVVTVQGSTMVEGELVPPDVIGGEIASHALPSTNAAVIALRTGQAGRSGRGRMFLPGITESSTQNSQVDAAFIAAAIAFLACMYEKFLVADPPAANQFYWCVWSRKDETAYPIISGTPRTVVGTMRSRKVGT